MPKMDTTTFRNTVREHGCHRSITLMEPYSQGSTTVTFHYDPQRGFAFVWLTCTTRDGTPLAVLGGAYRLERDWHISLFTDNARRVWDDLTARGWVQIAQGSIGYPATTK